MTEPKKIHFTPPLHIKTSACGYTLDNCLTNEEAHRELATIGILNPATMTEFEIGMAVDVGWCEGCLRIGFDDFKQMRGEFADLKKRKGVGK